MTRMPSEDKQPGRRENAPKKDGADREARLKAALKANITKRKAQARARASGRTE